MKKLALVILSLAILSLIGCSSTSSPATSTQLVSSWDGQGSAMVGSSVKTTETFHISKGEWYIETSCEALNPSGPIFLAASVFPKDKPVDNYSFVAIANQSTPGSATNYVHASGDFYLSIVGMNVKTWSVKVYQ
jgi:hypothetical protein